MFVLSSLEDNVPVAPPDLAKPLLGAVADSLRLRYLDRVVPGLGLAVALYSLDAVVGGGGRLYPATGTAGGGAGGGGTGGSGISGGAASEGSAYYRARFRLAFFRPFAGEVLVGTLVEATRWGGLRVAIGGLAARGGAAADGALAPPPPEPPSAAAAVPAADPDAAANPATLPSAADAVFRDVLVRPTDMPPKSSWDAQERTWVWSYEDGTPFLMDVGGMIRVRVSSVRYPSPPTPAERRQAQQRQQQREQQREQQQQAEGCADPADAAADADEPPPIGSAANPYAPMEVLASANGDGLGMVEWWTGGGKDEGDEGEADEAGDVEGADKAGAEATAATTEKAATAEEAAEGDDEGEGRDDGVAPMEEEP